MKKRKKKQGSRPRSLFAIHNHLIYHTVNLSFKRVCFLFGCSFLVTPALFKKWIFCLTICVVIFNIKLRRHYKTGLIYQTMIGENSHTCSHGKSLSFHKFLQSRMFISLQAVIILAADNGNSCESSGQCRSERVYIRLVASNCAMLSGRWLQKLCGVQPHAKAGHALSDLHWTELSQKFPLTASKMITA